MIFFQLVTIDKSWKHLMYNTCVNIRRCKREHEDVPVLLWNQKYTQIKKLWQIGQIS